MRPSRPVYIIGGAHTPYIGKHHPDFIWKGHPDYGKRENPGIADYLRRAARDALERTAVEAGDIDRSYVGNFAGECFARQAHLGSLLAGAMPGLRGKPAWRVEGACASGGLALVSGIEAISGGADLVLVAGVEVQTTVSAREGAEYLARAGHYEKQRALDPFTFPCLFARRARAYRESYGTSAEALASAVVKAHHNAARNPLAHLHAIGRDMTLEIASSTSERNAFFLEHPDYREYLRLLDCSPVSDGASAVVLASAAGARKAGRRVEAAAEVLGYGVSVSPLDDTEPDPLILETVTRAAAEAYDSSRRRPEDIDVAEVHDCFTIAEVEMMEALGFAARGEGATLIASGATSLGGERPVNPGGGLLGFGHPVGATGVKQALEIARQLGGECGEYQVAGPPRVGLSANMGGDDRTAVVVVYRRNSV